MELCTKLSDGVLSLEQIKTNEAAEIKKLKKRVKKLKVKKKKRTHGLKRMYRGRIAKIDVDEDLSLIDKTAQDQGRLNEEEMFGLDDLDGDEVIMDVTTGVEGTNAATTPQISKDELTLARTLIEIKAAKVARNLEAQMKAKMEEEERIAREKDKANIALIEEWDDVQATIYGYKQNDFKGKSFDAIKKTFDKAYKKVNTFMDMNTEIVEERSKKTQAQITEGGFKRAGDEIEQESANRQRLEKEDDSAELKRCLKIVPKDDDDVTIKATPLSSKSSTIVDYKIYKEGKKSYFKIIRPDGNSQNYLTFGKMFKNFNREDLEVLRSIVKTRFEKTKPVNDMDNLLFQTLKTMFEHQVDYEVEMAYDLLRLIRRQVNEGYIPA
nr:hypothetical protein [Tanacetum cinerariifolium]